MSDRPLISDFKTSSDMMQAYSKLFGSLKNQKGYDQSKTIVITSANAREGKTTIATNLALMYAMTQKKVLLIDANLEAPMLHDVFGLPNDQGLMNLLEKETSVGFSTFIKDTSYEGVSILTSGSKQYSLMKTLQLLSSENFQLLMNNVLSTYDLVLIDGPSAEYGLELEVLSSVADGVLLVVEYGKVKKKRLQTVVSQLKENKPPIIGTVMNKFIEGDFYIFSLIGEKLSISTRPKKGTKKNRLKALFSKSKAKKVIETPTDHGDDENEEPKRGDVRDEESVESLEDLLEGTNQTEEEK
ncbi:capsular exopolysaccharide synthesis family protein [Salirhabdus euzebyi]|uniref:non-specific protein-tyrosine kinase n=1 Tax=Salirhabdus euzebyi TaxID=394506 RepID=A0A841Q4H6_9BACI|nr:CpsD/CapB family tyrosine-protein kinase [Salirhabdus euzebyi]MBB6453295.1 capsular exopolysaccharide synthesis family protein [Salirhabdus euzebyi]